MEFPPRGGLDARCTGRVTGIGVNVSNRHEAGRARPRGGAAAVEWNEAAGIRAGVVTRSLARHPATPARYLGIAETAFARRHQDVTVMTALDRSQVLWVADTQQRRS